MSGERTVKMYQQPTPQFIGDAAQVLADACKAWPTTETTISTDAPPTHHIPAPHIDEGFQQNLSLCNHSINKDSYDWDVAMQGIGFGVVLTITAGFMLYGIYKVVAGIFYITKSAFRDWRAQS